MQGILRIKFILLLLAVMLAITAYTSGTGGSGTTETNPPAEKSTSKGDSTQGEASPPSNENEPAKITFYTTEYGRIVPPDAPMDIPAIQYLAEKTNTELDIQFLSH